jgi:prolyl 4-hydroxylase
MNHRIINKLNNIFIQYTYVTIVFLSGIYTELASAKSGDECEVTCCGQFHAYHLLVMVALALVVLVLGSLSLMHAKRHCRDRFDECKDHQTDCLDNPGFMVLNCPKTCNYCHLQNPSVRCNPSFLNVSTEPIVSPGEIDNIFQRIAASDVYNPQTLSSDPRIIEIPDFLSSSEVDELLNQVHPDAWEQSQESVAVDAETGEGLAAAASTRASASFWCRFDCATQSISQTIRQRISALLSISSSYFEPIQLLRYEEKGFYVSHYDHSDDELALLCGPRILTVFLYLSDVESGGETSFPELDINIVPKKGKAVLWTNVESASPTRKNMKTVHEAKEVKKGLKYAANIWVHYREWEKPALWACTG